MEISARHQEQKVTMPSGAEKVAVIKSSSSSSAAAAAAAEGGRIKKARPEKEEEVECPRCSSTKTKFCYYNNYSISQPRYFCKNCRRYWTQGGSLRNVPVGGGCRKSTTNKHHHQRSSASSSSFSPSSKMMMMNNKLHQLPMAMPMPMPAVFPPPACATGGSFFPNVLPTFIPSTVTGTGGFQLPGDHLSLASSNLGAGGGASASTFMDILTAGGGGGINGIFDGKNLENQLMMSSSDSDYYYGGGGGNNGMISMMPPPPQTTTTAAFGGGCDLMSQQHGLQLVGDDANNANNANTATASVAQLHGGGELASLEEQLGLGNAASGVDVMMGGAGAGPSSSSRDYCYWNSSTSSNSAGVANMPPWQGGLIDSSNPLM